jgi:recombination protein RecA
VPKKSLAERLKLLDGVSNDINKNAKKVLAGRLSKVVELQERIKTKFIEAPSMNVNEAIGGGIAKGKWTIVSGNYDSGKTFLLLETIAENQKKDPDFLALWLESEGSLTDETIDMLGIDRNRLYIIYHDRTYAGEGAIDHLEGYMASGCVDMVVVNSLKCLVPSEEFQKSMGSVQVGAQSRMNSKMVRKMSAIIEENEIAFVIVQHLTTNIGAAPHTDPMVLAGGNEIRYKADLIIDLRKGSIGESDPITREEGIKINVTVKKNHIVTGRFPYLKTSYYGIYGQGTEKYLEVLKLAIDQGILVKNGAFIKVPDENGDPQVINGEKMQWQGNAKFREYCINNPDFFENLKLQLNGEVDVMSDEEIKEAKQEEEEIEDVIEKASKEKEKKKK